MSAAIWAAIKVVVQFCASTTGTFWATRQECPEGVPVKVFGPFSTAWSDGRLRWVIGEQPAGGNVEGS